MERDHPSGRLPAALRIPSLTRAALRDGRCGRLLCVLGPARPVKPSMHTGVIRRRIPPGRIRQWYRRRSLPVASATSNGDHHHSADDQCNHQENEQNMPRLKTIHKAEPYRGRSRPRRVLLFFGQRSTQPCKYCSRGTYFPWNADDYPWAYMRYLSRFADLQLTRWDLCGRRGDRRSCRCTWIRHPGVVG